MRRWRRRRRKRGIYFCVEMSTLIIKKKKSNISHQKVQGKEKEDEKDK